jgi:hypothetical protein
MAGATGLEPATSGVTGRRSNQLSYAPMAFDRGGHPVPSGLTLSPPPQTCQANRRQPRQHPTQPDLVVRSKRMVPERFVNRTTRLIGWWCCSADRWGRPSVGIALFRRRNRTGDWWAMRGSNPRPPRCKRGALPAELIAPMPPSRVSHATPRHRSRSYRCNGGGGYDRSRAINSASRAAPCPP